MKFNQIAALKGHVSSLDREDLFNLAWELLYWQAVEIGDDVSVRFSDEDELEVEDIYWSSCGISLIKKEE